MELRPNSERKVSYKEPESDENPLSDSDDSAVEQKIVSKRKLYGKKRQFSYAKRSASKRTGTKIRKPGTCMICFTDHEDDLRCGKVIHGHGVTCHILCMYFASGLTQEEGAVDKYGEIYDKEAALYVDDVAVLHGFSIAKIQREIARGARLTCKYCHEKGATVGCAVPTCKMCFHLPCGIEHGSFHLYYDGFDHIPLHLLRGNVVERPEPRIAALSFDDCPICLEEVPMLGGPDVVRTRCCPLKRSGKFKNRWYHKHCLQQSALNAGMHHFKCLFCQNSSSEDGGFIKTLQLNGINIPDRDALWEFKDNSFYGQFEDQEREGRCELGDNCTCPEPDGPEFDHLDDFNMWCLKFCCVCGHKAIHRQCGNLLVSKELAGTDADVGKKWMCSECLEIINKPVAAEPAAAEAEAQADVVNISRDSSSRSRQSTSTPTPVNQSSQSGFVSPTCSSFFSPTSSVGSIKRGGAVERKVAVAHDGFGGLPQKKSPGNNNKHSRKRILSCSSPQRSSLRLANSGIDADQDGIGAELGNPSTSNDFGGRFMDQRKRLKGYIFDDSFDNE